MSLMLCLSLHRLRLFLPRAVFPTFFSIIGVVSVFLLPAGPSHAEIYKFVDENGLVTYTNMPRPGMKPKLIIPDYSRPPSPTPSSSPASPAKPSGKIATPSYFPKVDKSTQRKRDDMRLKLLQDEMRNEERNLATARTELNQSGGRPGVDLSKLTDAVRMHEKNIEMINKELSHLR